jgi:DNA-binding GntR family transcriptional regulator
LVFFVLLYISIYKLKRQYGWIERYHRVLENNSLTAQAYADIKQQLISGTIPAGQYFDAGQLAEKLNMSRTPIREALQRLEHEGIIEILAKKGNRAIPLTPDDLRDIYQVISGLEIEAVGNLCAGHPSDETLMPLFQSIEEMKKGLQSGRIDDWSLADESFHRALFDLCGNKRLCAEGLKFRDLAQRAHFVALRLISPEQKLKSIQSHEDLVRVIQLADIAKARALHYVQRERGGRLLVNIISNFGLTML